MRQCDRQATSMIRRRRRDAKKINRGTSHGEDGTRGSLWKKDKINLRALDTDLSFIGADKFSGAAGDVRFKKGTLELDKNGDGMADLALQLPGTSTESIKTSNLIL